MVCWWFDLRERLIDGGAASMVTVSFHAMLACSLAVRESSLKDRFILAVLDWRTRREH